MVLAVAVPVENRNPALGPAQGGKQSISVYDSKLGNNRTVLATPEECDKFVNDVALAKKQDSKKTWKTWAMSALAGLGIGGTAGAIMGKKENKAINVLVDKLNTELKQGKSWFEVNIKNTKLLDVVYDHSKKVFKSAGSKVASSVGACAAIGGIAATMLSLIPILKNHNKQTEKVTQDFIEQHK